MVAFRAVNTFLFVASESEWKNITRANFMDRTDVIINSRPTNKIDWTKQPNGIDDKIRIIVLTTS